MLYTFNVNMLYREQSSNFKINHVESPCMGGTQKALVMKLREILSSEICYIQTSCMKSQTTDILIIN